MLNNSIMEINTNDLREKAKELFNQEKFDEIIDLFTDEELKKISEKEKDKAAELYMERKCTV